MKTNPGSTVFLHIVHMGQNKKRFKRCYIAWATCKQVGEMDADLLSD